MAVREFTDSGGVVWRAWDVTPEQMHPQTRVEDFLFELSTGWLAFESAAEKRRLPAPYPADWSTMPIPALEELCRRAPSASRRRARNSDELRVDEAVAQIDREQRSSGERKFTSPRGREWTVRVHECIDRVGGQQRVLRYTADDIVVEIEEWPHAWADLSAEQHALLLLDANPPRRVGTTGPQRRRADRPDGED